MLPPAWRGFPRPVRVLALALLVPVGGAGCSHPPLLAAPHRYVRVDALLPLHPSWDQIRALDRELARLKTAPAQSGAFQYEPYPALPVFTPRISSPTNLAVERAQQVKEDAKRYVASVTNTVRNSNRSILAIERRREQRRIDAAVAARVADATQEMRNVNAVRMFAIAERLRSLAFRDIVVQSQIQDLEQAHTRDLKPLRDAQAEHAAIVAEAARLRAENAALRAQDVATTIARKRDAFYREERARSDERIAKREEELNAELQDKVAAAMSKQRDTAIPAPVAPRLPPPDPRATPLPLPPEPQVTLVSASSRVQSALARQSALWVAQRKALIDEIRLDTMKSVQQAANRRGWKLENAPAPGVADGTTEMADDLRAQWTIGKAP